MTASQDDLGFTHFGRVSLLMKQNKTSDPIDLQLFGPEAEVFYSRGGPNLIEQFRIVWSRADG